MGCINVSVHANIVSTTDYVSLKVDICKKDTIPVAIVQCHRRRLNIYINAIARKLAASLFDLLLRKTKLRNRPTVMEKNTSMMGV